MNSPYIYLITNIVNNHKYVGKHNGKRRNYFGSGIALKDAVKKYGKDNFIREIIEYCDAVKLNDREEYWIARHDTFKGKGYNLTPGGDGWKPGMKHSPATRKKMKENPSQKGKIRSKEVKDKISESLKKYYTSLSDTERRSIYGKSGKKLKGIPKGPFTEEHKKNLSRGQKGKKKSPRTKDHLEKIAKKNRKVIEMLDLQENFIKAFPSLTEASNMTGINKTSISCACSGKQKTAGNLIWRYKK